MTEACTWCAQPVTNPAFLTYWGKRLPYHPQCLDALQRPKAQPVTTQAAE